MGIGPPNMTSVVESYSTPGTRRRWDGPVPKTADGFPAKSTAPFTDTPTQGHIFPANGDTAVRFALQDIAGLYEVHIKLELRPASPTQGLEADRYLATVQGRARVLEVQRAAPWMEGPAGDTTWTVAVLQEVVNS